MDKEKFSYEVKDFKPTLKKKGMSTPLGAVLLILIAGLILISVIIIKKKRPSLSPEESVKKAFEDYFSELCGRDNYICDSLEAGEWLDLVRNGVYSSTLDIRVKEMADLGLGIEKYASGIGVSVSSVADAENKKSSGSISGSWTVVSLELLEYAFDSDELFISSNDFFKEVIRIAPKEIGIGGRTIRELSEEYIWDYLNDEEKEALSASRLFELRVDELLDKARLSASYEKTGEKKSFVIGGKERECDSYRVSIENELLTEPVLIMVYIDRAGRLIAADLSLNEGFRLELGIKNSGEERPSDKTELSLTIEYGNVVINGSLSSDTQKEKEGVRTFLSGRLDMPGLVLTGEAESFFDLTDNSFTFKFSGNDEVDEAVLAVEGKVTPDRDSFRIKFDNIDFDYAGEDIIRLGLSVKLKNVDQIMPDIGAHPESNVIDIQDINEDVIASITEQVKKRIDEYLDLLGDFDFL